MSARQGVPTVSISADGRRLRVVWPGGSEIVAPASWLYDNVEGARDAAGGHRLQGGLALDGARELADARFEGDDIVLRFAPGGETGRIRLAALTERPSGPPDVRLWPTPEALGVAPQVTFAAFLGDEKALAAALTELVRHGLVFLSGAGEVGGAVERAVARFGHIRETNYGRLFDVREEARPSHLAYSTVGLELHTDNPYRDPEPTLQLLHAIETAEAGGESQFVDGFAHAEALRREAPAKFRVLASTPVEFAYAGPGGERFSARAPVLELAAGGALKAVRLNHRSLAPLSLDGSVDVEAWYDAYLDYYGRVHASSARIERPLERGEMVIFDNRRILHGRASYAGGGRRWLQGCYADRDGLLATLSRLEANGAAKAREAAE
jgi:gamma-butyrobetaine dioxygenase